MEPQRSMTGSRTLPRRPRKSRMLGDMVATVLEPVLAKRGLAVATVTTEWASLAGPQLAPICVPLSMAWPPKPIIEAAQAKAGAAKGTGRLASPPSGAVLTLAVPSAQALVVQMASPQLIERINARLGFRAVGKIAISQRPLPPAPARVAPPSRDEGAIAAEEARLGDVADPALRQALARLGASVRKPPDGLRRTPLTKA